MMGKLLVVESDAEDARALAEWLQRERHDVTVVARAHDGLLAVRTSMPELAVIATALPDMSGTELCRELRSDGSTRGLPVILLSSVDDEIDRVVGFEVGADDVVVKPYSVRELGLRVRAVLRRRRRRRGVSLSSTTRVGALVLDPAALRVSVNGDTVSLSALEFKLLAALYDGQNHVLSRQHLLEDVWDAAERISERTVDACVKRLRQKLGPAGRHIETVRGVGYRFASPRAGSGSKQT